MVKLVFGPKRFAICWNVRKNNFPSFLLQFHVYQNFHYSFLGLKDFSTKKVDEKKIEFSPITFKFGSLSVAEDLKNNKENFVEKIVYNLFRIFFLGILWYVCRKKYFVKKSYIFLCVRIADPPKFPLPPSSLLPVRLGSQPVAQSSAPGQVWIETPSQLVIGYDWLTFLNQALKNL